MMPPMLAIQLGFTYFSREGVTSCFLNGSDPSIIARVSATRWDLNQPCFPSTQLLPNRLLPFIKARGPPQHWDRKEDSQRSCRDEGPRYETHALNAPFNWRMNVVVGATVMEAREMRREQRKGRDSCRYSTCPLLHIGHGAWANVGWLIAVPRQHLVRGPVHKGAWRSNDGRACRRYIKIEPGIYSTFPAPFLNL